MAARSERFGRLLKAGISSIANCEGTTAPAVEEDLGRRIGVSGATIQRYKAGHVPDQQAIEVLAEACVRRGYLNREWLQGLLAAARYPSPAQLVERLCPPVAPRDRPPRIYANLPAPSYSHFVMRRQAYSDMLDGLRRRSAVVLVASLGGMGKTSLAREVAAHCLAGTEGAPQFDAAVWISDKDRPGATNLSSVLDEIARTLDYPGLAQLAFDEKRFEVEQLLRRQCVLVVIDNFETITDRALADWLVRLPEPSKAIITTREFRREFRSSWPIDLGGMLEAEAEALIAERLRALKLGQQPGDAEQLRPLIAAVGGNPKAIELALGLMKYERRTSAQLVEDMQAARGELFDDLFARAWQLLGVPARQVLMALPLFVASAAAAALSAVAAVEGLPFEQALDQLADLALIDVQRERLGGAARYAQHPLARAFARARLAEQPGFAAAAHRRWLGWYCALARQVGFCWNDLGRLNLLDPEHETLHAALEWAYEQRHDAEALELIEGVRYYYNVRGLWDDRLAINGWRVAAARRLGDLSNEALGLAHDAEILSKQGRLAEAAELLPRLAQLAEQPGLHDDAVFEIQHALALHAHTGGELAAAERIWGALLPFAARLGGQKYVVCRRWLATCLLQQGRKAEARALFQAAIADAITVGDQRSVLGNRLKLAALDLGAGDLAAAGAALAACRADAERHQDGRRLAEWHRLAAQLHLGLGDYAAARAALDLAHDRLARLGMRRELTELQELAAQIDHAAQDARRSLARGE